MGVTQHPDPDNTLSLDGSRAKIHFDVKCVPARVAGAYQATSPRGRGGGDFAYHIPAPESEDLPGQNYGIISPYTGGIQRNYFDPVEELERDHRHDRGDHGPDLLPRYPPGEFVGTQERRLNSNVQRRRLQHLDAATGTPVLQRLNERYFALYDLLVQGEDSFGEVKYESCFLFNNSEHPLHRFRAVTDLKLLIEFICSNPAFGIGNDGIRRSLLREYVRVDGWPKAYHADVAYAAQRLCYAVLVVTNPKTNFDIRLRQGVRQYLCTLAQELRIVGVSAVKADTGNLPLLNLLVAAEKFATDAQPSFGKRYSTALIVTSGCQFAAEDPQQQIRAVKDFFKDQRWNPLDLPAISL
eukprot:COSAG06_NODE_7569_length_2456_cov_5.940178_2_plen_354_part_00